MREEAIREEFYTTATMEDVSKKYRCRQPYVKKVWLEAFGEDAFVQRKKLRYRESKLAHKNPMKGKSGDKHHLYKGDDAELSKSHGYVRIRKPDWYEGPSSDGYVLEHIVNYCECNGLSCLPEGMEIHHMDEDKENNHPSNLIMLTTSDHAKLHAWMKRTQRATTIPEGSRDDGNIPKRAAPLKGDDIV